MKIIKNIFIVLNILLFSCAENISPLNNTSSLNIKGDLNTLNIVTWNIENFPKNELTPDYVQTIIDSMEVDILALQEIRSLTSLNNIAYNLGASSDVSLVIYDMKGSIVKTLVSEFQDAGERNVIWNGNNDSGSQVSSGMYLVRMEAGGQVYQQAITLLK